MVKPRSMDGLHETLEVGQKDAPPQARREEGSVGGGKVIAAKDHVRAQFGCMLDDRNVVVNALCHNLLNIIRALDHACEGFGVAHVIAYRGPAVAHLEDDGAAPAM